MPRFSLKHYQSRMLIAMAVYTVFMLLAWPMVNKTANLPLKVLLAITPTVPVLYTIAQVARLIRNSDELERHTHLIALSTATAVVSALTFVVGFLAAARVVQLDGSSLLLVYPSMVACYALARWRVMRRYGESTQCDEELNVKPYWFMVLFGVLLLLAAALLAGHAGNDRLVSMDWTGCALIAGGLLTIVRRWIKRKYRHD